MHHFLLPRRVSVRLYQLCKPSSFAMLMLCILPLGSAQARWGALEVEERYRPDTTWLSGFNLQADVIAAGSIEDSIAQCDAIVGSNQYCVVEVGNNADLVPFTVSRPRTKIIGADGMNPILSRDGQASIYVGNRVHHVVLENLSLLGHNARDEDVYGILLYGESIRRIVIKSNRIHSFYSDSNAHAIAVFGTADNSREAIHNIVISDNDIRDMRTGSSESIVMNGNVRRWEIDGNYLENINNIGIDAIGGEGTSPTRVVDGKIVPGHFDAARQGWITNNSVINMSTRNNPAYGSQESWAAAIYIDGGRYIHVEGNTVENTPWAYDIGAENCVFTRNITMRYNTASGSYYGDFLAGGYSPGGFRSPSEEINCDPETSEDPDEGHGYVANITIEENEFNSDATRISPVLVQYRTRGALILQSGVEPSNEEGNGGAPGDENAVRITR